MFERQPILFVWISRPWLGEEWCCLDINAVIRDLGPMKIYVRTWARVNTFDHRSAALNMPWYQLIDIHGATILQKFALCLLVKRSFTN